MCISLFLRDNYTKDQNTFHLFHHHRNNYTAAVKAVFVPLSYKHLYLSIGDKLPTPQTYLQVFVVEQP